MHGCILSQTVIRAALELVLSMGVGPPLVARNAPPVQHGSTSVVLP